MFYIGNKIDNVVDDKIRLLKNKTKSWKYGYDKELDTVIISKDGTLGEIYNIYGLNIGLPQKPDNKEFLNFGITTKNQKWKREEMPQGLNKDTQNDKKYEDYIIDQFKKRDEGAWLFVNGKPIYITGTYWFGLQWFRELVEPISFRNIQNELMIFWEACKADNRSFGMQYAKNRRLGASLLGLIELLESGTINEDKILGIVSKTGGDSSNLFKRLIKGFRRLPCFFQPVWDGTNAPKKILVLDVPTRKRSKNQVEIEDGLGSSIGWFNTTINSMDGDAIFRSLLDESSKYGKDVPFDKYWYVVKTSHTKGIRITGKSMVISTVNAKKQGGAEYQKIWKDSDISKRDANGQTVSGLYRLFIPAKFCLEGMFDEYGFTIIEDPINPIMTDEGIETNIGSVTWLNNKAESLKNDPETLNEFLRQQPNKESDAFRDESSDCAFNLMKLSEQIDHNTYELEDNDYGNNEVERGNFSWIGGIQDGDVKWNPDPITGRFWIVKNCHPPLEYRNKKERKMINGVLAFAPMNENIGCFGVDPYNRDKTADGRGSNGSIHLSTKFNTGPFPNNKFILEYIDRASKVELFYEDVLMAMVYFSMPMLPELSSEKFSSFYRDRGYRHFVLNNPFKNWSDLSVTEKNFGGVPAQDAKVGERQFYCVQSYIEDHIGVSRDESERPIGEMGFMPFTRTLEQWKDVDIKDRTKYDAYISSSLSLLGNEKKIKQEIEKKPLELFSLFRRFDNSGGVSQKY
ncbi:hypothetical protein H0H26_11535 [Flavobacterium psychrophilum]|uniref:Uncharacterized protein n=1 Tax=Flavobacterium psychrophilum TaxID=96345 RepID=A0A7U2NHT1_FLAPS|nr:hypothetical protein H0H26_11535 [Flavobacterium psychrophilum]